MAAAPKRKYNQKVLARAQIGPPISDWINDDKAPELLAFLRKAETESQEQEQLADWVASALYHKEYMQLTVILKLVDEMSIEEALIRRAADYLQQFVIDNCDRQDLMDKRNTVVARLIQGSLAVPKYVSTEAFDLCKSVVYNQGEPVVLTYPASTVLLATTGDPWIIDNGHKVFSMWASVVEQEGKSSTCYHFAVKWLERAAKEMANSDADRKHEVAKIVGQIMDKYDYVSWYPVWSDDGSGK